MLGAANSLSPSALAAIAFTAALVASLLATPFARALAWRFGALAKPDARRTHPEPTAQWGGIAIFVAVAFAALLWRQPTVADFRFLVPSVSPENINAAATNLSRTLNLSTYFFGCGLLMLLLGMADDRFELRPFWKFSGQLVIVYILWRGGFRITTLPFTEGTQNLLDWQSLLLTSLWILGITNGVNFIDGVDGLASGVCAIAAGSLCILYLNKSAGWAAAASAAVCGASLGFLRYNYHPAKIFLGDSGALLLGFWLAAISVAAAAKTAAATTLALPLLVMGIPVLDTLWAVVRRTLAHQPPWRADRGHLHHRLLARGFSPQKTVLLIYAVAAVLGAFAVVLARTHG
jgi:UDP-GlcNAc:undecaprenyl-phosphate GlcNAc-1-phosphate transferase